MISRRHETMEIFSTRHERFRKMRLYENAFHLLYSKVDLPPWMGNIDRHHSKDASNPCPFPDAFAMHACSKVILFSPA